MRQGGAMSGIIPEGIRKGLLAWGLQRYPVRRGESGGQRKWRGMVRGPGPMSLTQTHCPESSSGQCEPPHGHRYSCYVVLVFRGRCNNNLRLGGFSQQKAILPQSRGQGRTFLVSSSCWWPELLASSTVSLHLCLPPLRVSSLLSLIRTFH